MLRIKLDLKLQAQNEQSVHIALSRQTACASANNVRKVTRHSSRDYRRDGSLLWRKCIIIVTCQTGQTSADSEQKNVTSGRKMLLSVWWQKFHFQRNLMMATVIIIIIIINTQNYLRIYDQVLSLPPLVFFPCFCYLCNCVDCFCLCIVLFV